MYVIPNTLYYNALMSIIVCWRKTSNYDLVRISGLLYHRSV